MPILSYDTLDAVPKDLQSFAKPIEGGDGRVQVNVVPATKIDEFRDNNIALSKERDTLKSQLAIFQPIVGEDVEGFVKNLEELKVTAQRVKDGELKEGRQIEEALGKRTEELRKSYDERLQAEAKEKAAWRTKYDGLEQKYKLEKVAAYIKDAAVDGASGVEPKAIGDLVNVGLSVFRIDDAGKIIPFEGDAPIYGTDGTSPMTAREWLQKVKEDKPFFFKGTGGGGAGNSTTEKRVHGVTQADLKKKSASELLDLANAQAPRKAQG